MLFNLLVLLRNAVSIFKYARTYPIIAVLAMGIYVGVDLYDVEVPYSIFNESPCEHNTYQDNIVIIENITACPTIIEEINHGN